MKKSLFLAGLLGIIYFIQASAQVAAPVVAPVVPAAPAFNLFSVSTLASIALIISCLNIVLSAIQEIFAKLAKSEPGWLQSLSAIVLKIAQYLGSNPKI